MAQSKYLAAGFLPDAEKLLYDFVERNSYDFSAFCEVWKKAMFSLIYMGRASEPELAEFTQEIFRLSAELLTSSTSSRFQVGTIYLLYALYRNQIMVPLLKVRLVMSQWKVVMNIREAFDASLHKSLHYIIDYLVKHALVFVACPTLMGPDVPIFREKGNRNPWRLNAAEITSLKSNLIELNESGVLEDLSDLLTRYTKTKSSINAGVSKSDSVRRITELSAELQNLLSDARVTGKKSKTYISTPKTSVKSIGSERLQLKAKARSTFNPGPRNTESATETENVEESQLNKTLRTGELNNQRRKRARTWHYSEQSNCEDSKIDWFNMNLPLVSELDEPLSSEDSETIDTPDGSSYIDTLPC